MKRVSILQKAEKPEANDSDNLQVTSPALNKFDARIARTLFVEFAKTLTQEKRGSIASFFADPLIEVNDHIVVFTVGSKIVAEEIEKLKKRAKLLFADQGFLLADIECKVNAAEISEYKVFTPQQKFEVMSKKHPILKDFAARFNLEIN